LRSAVAAAFSSGFSSLIQPVSTEFIRMAELARSSSAQVRVIMLSAAWGDN